MAIIYNTPEAIINNIILLNKINCDKSAFNILYILLLICKFKNEIFKKVS